MTLHDHVKAFAEHIEAKSYSPRTVESYVRHAKAFVGYLERYYPRIARANQITGAIVDDYQQFIREAKTRDDRPPANTTVRLKLNALKSFFSFLVDRDLVLRDPTAAIVAPKEEQRLTRRVPSPQETIEILQSVEPRDATSMRDRAHRERGRHRLRRSTPRPRIVGDYATVPEDRDWRPQAAARAVSSSRNWIRRPVKLSDGTRHGGRVERSVGCLGEADGVVEQAMARRVVSSPT